MAKQGKKHLSRFLHYADLFYLSIGMLAYERTKHDGRRQWLALLLRAYFIFHVLNLNFVLITESIYVCLAIQKGSNFIEATMNLCYIGFVFVGDLKIWLIWRAHDKLTRAVQALRALHPKDVPAERMYKVRDFYRRYRRISVFFLSAHMLLIWMYNLYWAVYYLVYDFWLQLRVFERSLPYYCWVPWDWRDNWTYYMMYVSQNIAGQTCISGQLACDMMMCAMVTLLIMHYQHLAQRIMQHVAVGQHADADADMNFIRSIVDYHQKILDLCDLVNDIFGFSLLVSFLCSSFIMCFLGFQLTIGSKIDTLVMLFLFLFCSVVQIYMISNNAQQLNDSSSQIGDAVYNHNWHDADVHYRKMLILIIERAQKPSLLQATAFLKITLATMTSILQLSYKFFALLRTMYVD